MVDGREIGKKQDRMMDCFAVSKMRKGVEGILSKTKTETADKTIPSQTPTGLELDSVVGVFKLLEESAIWNYCFSITTTHPLQFRQYEGRYIL
jgi:hypothetical protein